MGDAVFRVERQHHLTRAVSLAQRAHRPLGPADQRAVDERFAARVGDVGLRVEVSEQIRPNAPTSRRLHPVIVAEEAGDAIPGDATPRLDVVPVAL